MREYLIIGGYPPTEYAYIVEADDVPDAVAIWKNSQHWDATYKVPYRVLSIQRVSAAKKLVDNA